MWCTVMASDGQLQRKFVSHYSLTSRMGCHSTTYTERHTRHQAKDLGQLLQSGVSKLILVGLPESMHDGLTGPAVSH